MEILYLLKTVIWKCIVWNQKCCKITINIQKQLHYLYRLQTFRLGLCSMSNVYSFMSSVRVKSFWVTSATICMCPLSIKKREGEGQKLISNFLYSIVSEHLPSDNSEWLELYATYTMIGILRGILKPRRLPFVVNVAYNQSCQICVIS